MTNGKEGESRHAEEIMVGKSTYFRKFGETLEIGNLTVFPSPQERVELEEQEKIKGHNLTCVDRFGRRIG